MITRELTDYVRAEFEKGTKREEIRRNLLAGGGWNEIDVDQAFRAVAPIGSIGMDTPPVLPKVTIAPPLALEKKETPKIEPKIETPKEPLINLKQPLSVAPSFITEPSKPPTPTPSIATPTIPPPHVSISKEFILPKTNMDLGTMRMDRMESPEIVLPPKNFEVKKAQTFQQPVVKKFHWKILFSFAAAICILVIFWFNQKELMQLPAKAATFASSFFSNIQIPSNNKDIPEPVAPVVEEPTPPALVTPSVPETPVVVTPPIVKPVENPIIGIKDCGSAYAPDIKNPATYNKDPAMTCMGESAQKCEAAQVTLKGTFFPDIFQVVKKGNTCDFKLSYASGSALSDLFGAKLAGKSIECPVSIVKGIDANIATSPSFFTPSKVPAIFAAQVYFYGTVGVFVDYNLNQAAIEKAGCQGTFIQSIIDSYQRVRAKT